MSRAWPAEAARLSTAWPAAERGCPGPGRQRQRRWLLQASGAPSHSLREASADLPQAGSGCFHVHSGPGPAPGCKTPSCLCSCKAACGCGAGTQLPGTCAKGFVTSSRIGREWQCSRGHWVGGAEPRVWKRMPTTGREQVGGSAEKPVAGWVESCSSNKRYCSGHIFEEVAQGAGSGLRLCSRVPTEVAAKGKSTGFISTGWARSWGDCAAIRRGCGWPNTSRPRKFEHTAVSEVQNMVRRPARRAHGRGRAHDWAQALAGGHRLKERAVTAGWESGLGF